MTECKFDCKNRFRLFSDKRLEVSKLANMKRAKVCVCVRAKKKSVVVAEREQQRGVIGALITCSSTF